MEKIAGVAIFAVGIPILAFGRARVGSVDRRLAGPWRLPGWMDVAIQWGSGALSLWFGLQLFFGHAHFSVAPTARPATAGPGSNVRPLGRRS